MSAPVEPAGGEPAIFARRARKLSADDREKAILTTLGVLLQDKSLQQISIDELARSAGISRPTFYFYFGSKEAALGVLIERVIGEARQERGQALQRLAESPKERWRDAIAAFYETAYKHRKVLVAGVEAKYLSPAVNQIWSSALNVVVEEISSAIDGERARGAAAGGVPSRDLATALTLMTERVFETTLTEHSPSIANPHVIDVLTAAWIGGIYGGLDVAQAATRSGRSADTPSSAGAKPRTNAG